MTKIIVTGGAGFIGGHLVDRLIKEGHRVIVLDDLSGGKKENINSQAEFHEVDICDFDKISPLFEGVDCVFHEAAIPRVPVSIEDPIGTSEANIMGTISVLKAAKDNNVRRVIIASSSSVYGNQKELPLRESMIPGPISPYALQKHVDEQFAKMFTDLYKLPVVCLRYFNVYGTRIDPTSEYSLVLGKFLTLNNQNKPLTIFGDGEQTRGFCYVDDVVGANIKAMTSEKLKGGEIINIGSDKSHSVNYLASLISDRVEHLPVRVGDILHTNADVSLAKELLDWEPKIDFNQGIQIVKDWFKNNYNN